MKLGEIVIPTFFQGPTGQGQGGWTASRLAEFVDGPATMSLRAPTPLDRSLDVIQAESGADLIDPDTGTVLMQARPWAPAFPETTPVPIAAAAVARTGFIFAKGGHPVPLCFSCGTHAQSMGTHPGPLGDGRVATDWQGPDWAVGADGMIDPGCLWAALDCTSGFYVAADGAVRVSFTAQYAVDVLAPIRPGARYAIVAWNGDAPASWDGRKRHAAAAAFDRDGRLVAQAVSFWIAARDQT